MKTFFYTYEMQDEYRLPVCLTSQIDISKSLFFDIETTGFIAGNTTLYLIGALHYQGDKVQVVQWFNEDGYNEAELILAFTEFARDYDCLIHFNGIGFDLSYLKQKSELLGLNFELGQKMKQFDIFREIKPLKKILGLANLKQKTIENYLGIQRKDTYSGADLINIYQRYVARPDEVKEHLLLLHNHDDLLGMPAICKILNYIGFFTDITIKEIHMETTPNTLQLHFEYEDTIYLHKRMVYDNGGLHLNACDNAATLTVPLTHATLKHFYPDCENYYYLPLEDVAIHKSVAQYVEKENRKKATKNTCYTKDDGCFIPCFLENHRETFGENFKGRNKYQRLEALTDANVAEQTGYVKNALLSLYGKKPQPSPHTSE